MKLHIQLEPYTGVKFDFIEVDVKLSQIKDVYAQLEQEFGKPKQVASNYGTTKTTSAPKIEFGGLPLSQAQIDAIKKNGWTEQDLKNANVSYETLGQFFKKKEVQEVAVAEPKPSEVPWEVEL